MMKIIEKDGTEHLTKDIIQTGGCLYPTLWFEDIKGESQSIWIEDVKSIESIKE